MGIQVTEPVKLELLQTPLKQKLETLETDVASLTERVSKLQSLAGVKGATPPASLQAVAVHVVPAVNESASQDDLPEISQLSTNVSSAEKGRGAAFLEIQNSEDDTLEDMVEDLEGKVEWLKSSTLDLENMLLGTNEVTAINLPPKNDTESMNSLASRATILEMEVASLKSRVSSLDQAVTGTAATPPA